MSVKKSNAFITKQTLIFIVFSRYLQLAGCPERMQITTVIKAAHSEVHDGGGPEIGQCKTPLR